MSDLIEGLGTATEGGLFARVLDPGSGKKERHEGDPEDCLNCGTRLAGAYCHACGQSGHVHRTIGAFMHDLLHGALHFEGKMWRTLPMLALRPGKLTRRYIEGARARFVSPMALFLFSVFLMFAVFQVLGITTPTDIGGEDTSSAAETGGEFVRGMRDALEENPEIAAQPGMADTGRAIEEAIIQSAQAIEEQDTASQSDAAAAGEEDLQPEVFPLGEEGDAQMTVSPSGIDFLDEGIFKKWRDNPSLMLYKLQANSYKFSWLLIPLSLPFVWLMFAWKRRYRGYDHAIFITYSLSFMTLLFVALSLLHAIGVGGGWLFTIFATLAPLHLYRQLRGAYELSRFSAVWRLLVLMVFIVIILVLFLQVLLLLGAF